MCVCVFVFRAPAAEHQAAGCCFQSLCTCKHLLVCAVLSSLPVCLCILHVCESMSLLPQEALQHTLNEVPWKGWREGGECVCLCCLRMCVFPLFFSPVAF